MLASRYKGIVWPCQSANEELFTEEKTCVLFLDNEKKKFDIWFPFTFLIEAVFDQINQAVTCFFP